MTIHELVAAYSKVPGDIKIWCSEWRAHEFFIPYFRENKSNIWHGLDEEGEPYKFMEFECDDLRLYKEPKKKILYQYAYKKYGDPHLGEWILSEHCLYDDLPFANIHYIRLENTRKEVKE